MSNRLRTRENLWPYSTEPVGAHKLPTGPWSVGRLTLGATPIRPVGRCSTHLVGHWPRGPPHRQNRWGALSDDRCLEAWLSKTAALRLRLAHTPPV
jgi:hypothetical protein